MSLRVTAVALIGKDHDYLETILRNWLDDGFQVDTPAVDFATDLLARIEETSHP